MELNSDFVAEIQARELMITRERLQAMDNLLALWGLERQQQIYGGGVVAYRPGNKLSTVWLGAWDTEEAWLGSIEHFLAR